MGNGSTTSVYFLLQTFCWLQKWSYQLKIWQKYWKFFHAGRYWKWTIADKPKKYSISYSSTNAIMPVEKLKKSGRPNQCYSISTFNFFVETCPSIRQSNCLVSVVSILPLQQNENWTLFLFMLFANCSWTHTHDMNFPPFSTKTDWIGDAHLIL